MSDPMWSHIRVLGDVPPHLLKEIEHFFRIYEELEDKKTGVEGWEDLAAAERVIDESRQRFEAAQVAAGSGESS